MNQRPADCVLRCTQHFGPKPSLSFEEAAQFLHQLCQGQGANLTYSWQFIDRPNDGDVFVYFQVSAPTPLIDGLQYLEAESSYRPTPTQDLEVYETRFGFIPGVNEKEAARVRRRYRLAHGGHPNIVLVHYSRGPGKPVPPNTMPIRNYPLPTINEPPMYVIGEKSGQRVLPPNAAQLVNQQQQLEARRQAAALQPQAPNVMRRQDEDSDEESNKVSTRALASTRFKRNHELLAEIFAVGAVANAKVIPSPYEKVDQAELEAKLAKANEELVALREKADQQEKDLQEVIAAEEASAPPKEAPKATT